VRFLLYIIVATVFTSTGCASSEALRGLPPFFEERPTGDDIPDTVIRPFFRFKEDPREQSEEIHYLFPFGHYKKRPKDVEHHLYPVFQWMTRTDDEGFTEKDLLVFPLFFWGDHPGQGSYFTLIPFGGTLRGLLGKDYVAHFLFPLFAYTRLKTYETYHLLFPILSWSTGSGNEGFRFLPFFGYRKAFTDEGVLRSEHYTVLWPLVSWGTDNAMSRNPYTSFAVFPFYGETKSKFVDEWNLLWPFFRFRDEKKKGTQHLRIPFPFVMLSWGTETQVDLWPFYGVRKEGGYARHFALWPFLRSERFEDAESVKLRRWFLPFVWTWSETDKATGEPLYRQTKLWPLVRFDDRKDGAYSLRAPSLLWFHDTPGDLFETLLTPLLELFRYTDDPENGIELRLLSSAFKAKWGRPDDAESGWSFLGGLFGWRRTREGDGLVRLFYFLEF